MAVHYLEAHFIAAVFHRLRTYSCWNEVKSSNCFKWRQEAYSRSSLGNTSSFPDSDICPVSLLHSTPHKSLPFLRKLTPQLLIYMTQYVYISKNCISRSCVSTGMMNAILKLLLIFLHAAVTYSFLSLGGSTKLDSGIWLWLTLAISFWLLLCYLYSLSLSHSGKKIVSALHLPPPLSLSLLLSVSLSITQTHTSTQRTRQGIAAFHAQHFHPLYPTLT